MARWALLPLLVASMLGCAWAQEAIIVPPTRLSDVQLGSCGTVRMPDVLFIRNQTLVREGRTWRISGETLVIENGEYQYPRHVGWLFPGEDIDVELSFALVDDELLLHWRETFRHKSYRQGLLRVVDTELEEVCRGSGGFDVSH